MREEYQPSTREICAEIWSRGEDSHKRNLQIAGSALKEFCFSSTKICAITALGLYTIPTVGRKIREEIAIKDEIDSLPKHYGELTGGAIGTVAGVVQLFGYCHLATGDHPELLSIPVATNIISGIYELGRTSYRNARQRLLEKHTDKAGE